MSSPVRPAGVSEELPEPRAPEPGGIPRLVVEELSIRFPAGNGEIVAAERVNLRCDLDEILAIVGESGSGKSVTALAIMGLLPHNARVSGSIRLDGQELLGLPEREMARLRGSRLSMIFQNPRASLNPSLSIGSQMIEVVRRHAPEISRQDARTRCAHVLTRLRLRQPDALLDKYPHQLSGGMCQRVALGIALLGSPRLLIADEPTTALDVIVQANTLRLLREIHEREAIPVIIVTHDFGVVSALATNVAVMYAGQVQEFGPASGVLGMPSHPYTRALIAALPDRVAKGGRLQQINGHPPDPARFPAGCRFNARCFQDAAICTQMPIPNPAGHDGFARCHFPARPGQQS